MNGAAKVAPADSDLLCESCGYTLNGLETTGRCPECGRPIAESLGDQRLSPQWESSSPGAKSLLCTTAGVIFRPGRFYRTLRTRSKNDRSAEFAQIHWWLAATGFGVAAWFHAAWYLQMWGWRIMQPRIVMIGLPLTIGLIYLLLIFTTSLAARLTHWEATYRGIRLPLPVVRRGLNFHAAHYLPVAMIAALTVVGYQVLLDWRIFTVRTAVAYLYVLSAEVLLGAGYLFQTYWTGMKNMMFANR
jgi:hypothetical protein